MELVQNVRPPIRQSPGIQVIYSSPKSGKTTITSKLKNHLILELEPGGADYVSGRIQQINKPSEFNEVLDLIMKSETLVADYLIIDTITKLDEWSEVVGTYAYMNKSQGQCFNKVGGTKLGRMITHIEKEFETIHALPNGYGYAHSRQVMTDWYDKLMELITLGKVKYIILLTHVKDRLIEAKNGDSVESIDLNLTGKVKSIFSSRVDAVGHLFRENNNCYLSYNNDHKVVCGGRCSHLSGKILISEKDNNGEIITHWDKIFID